MRNKIFVCGIKVKSFHGCLDEEALIGGDYTVDIELETNFSESFETDALKHTIDYSMVYAIVKQEMNVRSKLIEHVANRILKRLQSELNQPLHRCLVRVVKHNPPMNGQIENVSVEIES